MAIPDERTRFYARLRTRRISNGLVEFFRDSLPDGRPGTLVVENVEHAEPTDLEFLAALVRRIDPDRLTVVICSGTDELPDPELTSVLGSRAENDCRRDRQPWPGRRRRRQLRRRLGLRRRGLHQRRRPPPACL